MKYGANNEAEDHDVLLTYKVPGGLAQVPTTRASVAEHRGDTASVIAEHLGVTLDDFEDWQQSGFTAQCSGITKKGRQCRHAVVGASCCDIHDFLSKRGGRCHWHEDQT